MSPQQSPAPSAPTALDAATLPAPPLALSMAQDCADDAAAAAPDLLAAALAVLADWDAPAMPGSSHLARNFEALRAAIARGWCGAAAPDCGGLSP